VSLANGAFSIFGLVTVLIPLPLLVLQLVGAVVLAGRLPAGSRRSLGVAAFAAGALATLCWLAGSLTARVAPTIVSEYDASPRHIGAVLGLIGWAGGLVGAAAVLLVVLAMLKTSPRSEYRTW
jgi:hypothetical protein